MQRPREVVQEWVAAYNQRDAYAAAELYQEDATNLQVALGAPTVGRQAILDDLISFFNAYPDNFTQIENLFEDGEWAILEWFGGGTWLGEFGGMARTEGRSPCVGAASSTFPKVRSASSAGISIRSRGSANLASQLPEDCLPALPHTPWPALEAFLRKLCGG